MVLIARGDNSGNGVFYAMLARYLDQGLVYVFGTNDGRNTCPAGQVRLQCLGNLAIDAELRRVLFGDSGS